MYLVGLQNDDNWTIWLIFVLKVDQVSFQNIKNACIRPQGFPGHTHINRSCEIYTTGRHQKKKFASADCDTIHTIYLSLYTQSSVSYRGFHEKGSPSYLGAQTQIDSRH